MGSTLKSTENVNKTKPHRALHHSSPLHLLKYRKPSLSPTRLKHFTNHHTMPTHRQQPHQRSLYDEAADDHGDSSLSTTLESSVSPESSEKQISVDPMSLKPKFVSVSLPCSTTSSPQPQPGSLTLSASFKKWHAPDHNYPAAVAPPNTTTRGHGPPIRRSKSCGEGRACRPADDFDILPPRPGLQKPQADTVQVIYEYHDDNISRNCDVEQEFKCGALCLFLPGFNSKKKQVTATDRRAVSRMASLERLSRAVSLERVSRVASLEKFECGSWSGSAAMIGDDEEEEDGGVGSSYFDLPLELIKSGSNESESPVKAAFVYERERRPAGVLKKNKSRLAGPRKSTHESSNRHVRFSTSVATSYPPSPSSACITPRLLRAREEFNALLEAQGVL